MHCLICSSSTVPSEDLCDLCQELLRWFREYFTHDLGEENLDSLTLETRFWEDLGLDSLDYVNWQLEAEEKLGIEIQDEELARVQTIHDLLAILRNKGATWPTHKQIQLVQMGNCLKQHVWQTKTTLPSLGES